MFVEGSVVKTAGLEGDPGFFEQFLGLILVSDELGLGAVHFGFEQTEPLVEVILADWVFDFVVVFEGVLEVHFGAGIFLFQVLDVPQSPFTAGSTEPAPFQREHFQS